MYGVSRYLSTRLLRNSQTLGVPTKCYASDSVHGVHSETSLHKDDKGLKEKKTLPEFADVVVIGGGSVGCSTAYHLAKLNAGKVVLLERDRLTSGTTWHTGGILFNLRDGRALTQMQLQTRELLEKILPEETGYDAGWIETGSVFFTRDKNQLDGLEKKSLIGSEFGAKTWMVDADEIARLHPLMNTKGIVGGVYSPHDGSLDPATLCSSYIKAATKYGAKVFEKCEVNDIKTSQGPLGIRKVAAVETNLGTIQTNYVVNCAGAWAPYITKMVGFGLPQVTHKHAYVITQGIPGIETTPHLRDTEYGMYHKRQGDALLFGGYEKDPDLVGMVPEKDFSFGLYDMDWEKFERFMEVAIDLIPSVGKVGIRSTICGPEAFTPDSRPLMGETPDLRGFFVGSAFNSGGMMMGGGAGRQLAHWVVNGSPEYDMQEVDINRFTRKHDETWVIDTSHDIFIARFDVHHPYSQKMAGRNLRTTPLTEHHISNGAYMNSIHGWEVPMYFMEGQTFPLLEYDYFGVYGKKRHENYSYREYAARDASFDFDKEIHEQIVKESHTCYESVGILDLTHLSKFIISGSNANDVVRALFSTDVASIKENSSTVTLLLDGKGSIVAYVNVSKEIGGSYMVTGASELQDFILRHINQYFIDNDVKNCKFEDVTDNYALLNIVGPQSVDLLGNVLPDFQENLEAGEIVKSKIRDAGVTIRRSESSEVAMYEIQCAMNDIKTIYKTLTLSSNFQPTQVGLRAFNSILLETDQQNPAVSRYLAGASPKEANLMKLCPLEGNRDYRGKKALAESSSKPLNVRLIHLTADSDFPVLPHDLIWRDGKYTGTIEDSAYGSKSGKYHITGYLKTPLGEPVTEEMISSGKFTVGRWTRKAEAQIVN